MDVKIPLRYYKSRIYSGFFIVCDRKYQKTDKYQRQKLT